VLCETAGVIRAIPLSPQVSELRCDQRTSDMARHATVSRNRLSPALSGPVGAWQTGSRCTGRERLRLALRAV
jgi:hypothetical protein